MAKTKGPRQGPRRGPAGPACAICRQPVGPQAKATAKSGRTVHARCLAQATRAGNRSANPQQTAAPSASGLPVPRSEPRPAPGLEGSTVARFGGHCAVCAGPYAAGERITKAAGVWVHIACRPPAEFRENQTAVLSLDGDTYRGQAASSWRRKTRRR